MPYSVAELAFGTEGRTRPAKVFPNGRPVEYLTDDEIAVWEHVQYLERELEVARALNRPEEPGPLSASEYVPDSDQAHTEEPLEEEPTESKKSKANRNRSQRT